MGLLCRSGRVVEAASAVRVRAGWVGWWSGLPEGAGDVVGAVVCAGAGGAVPAGARGQVADLVPAGGFEARAVLGMLGVGDHSAVADRAGRSPGRGVEPGTGRGRAEAGQAGDF